MDVVEPVSERAHMLAAEHQLGEAQAEYAEEMPGWLALAGFLFVGICIVSCAVFTISNPSSSSGGDDPGWLHGLNVFGRVINGVAILIVGASMLLGALFVIGVKLSRGRAYIYICERGFMRVTRRGTQLVRWSDIKELRLGIQRARGQAEDSGTRDIKYTPFY